MKKNKIFLGISTFLLAIAGVSAARRSGPSMQRYYCTVTSSTPVCASAGTFSYVSDPNGVNTVSVWFTVKVGPIHVSHHKVVYTHGTTGAPCSAVNCLHPLRYNLSN